MAAQLRQAHAHGRLAQFQVFRGLGYAAGAIQFADDGKEPQINVLHSPSDWRLGYHKNACKTQGLEKAVPVCPEESQQGERRKPASVHALYNGSSMTRARLTAVDSPPKPPRAKGFSKGSSQTARAALALRTMLLEGRFQPGQRIREVPLAAELGVSRIPLRLVLERLAHEGLLLVRPTRGFEAQLFTAADINEAIELRGLLEGMAARLAAERFRDAKDIAPLEALNGEIARIVKRKNSMDHLEDYIDSNARFHAEILRLSKSPILARAMEHTCSLPFASPSAFVKRRYTAADSIELFHAAVDQHRGILEAIANRESARAELLAREHARLARRNLEAALKNGEIQKFLPGMRLVKF
jgi:GntR family transcriptional regulator of vanillate catabolism